MREVVDSFKKQCGYISSIDSNIVNFLDEQYKKAQAEVAEESLACFRQSMTQIGSVNYIYKKLCNELTQAKGPLKKSDLIRIFVGTQKYRKGIRLEHSVLNDCLRLAKNGSKYLVDVNFNRIKTVYLKERLDQVRPNKDLQTNRVNYR